MSPPRTRTKCSRERERELDTRERERELHKRERERESDRRERERARATHFVLHYADRLAVEPPRVRREGASVEA